jgi:hypothetical protein
VGWPITDHGRLPLLQFGVVNDGGNNLAIIPNLSRLGLLQRHHFKGAMSQHRESR